MFHRSTDEIFNELPNVFGIADDTLIVRHDDNGTDHKNTMQSTADMQKRKSKAYKHKYHFRSTSIPFLVKLFHGVV